MRVCMQKQLSDGPHCQGPPSKVGCGERGTFPHHTQHTTPPHNHKVQTPTRTQEWTTTQGVWVWCVAREGGGKGGTTKHEHVCDPHQTGQRPPLPFLFFLLGGGVVIFPPSLCGVHVAIWTVLGGFCFWPFRTGASQGEVQGTSWWEGVVCSEGKGGHTRCVSGSQHRRGEVHHRVQGGVVGVVVERRRSVKRLFTQLGKVPGTEVRWLFSFLGFR